MERKYYVYEHREADTGRTFYVGKGCGKRSGNAFHRSLWWKRIVKKHGFTVHRIYENITEVESIILEKYIIEAYGMENLCNMTKGGDGLSGYKHTDYTKKLMGHAKKDKEIHKFYHDEHGEFIGTRHDHYLKYKLTKVDRCNISAMVRDGRYSQVKGWRVEGCKYQKKEIYRPKPRDLVEYCLIHDDGRFYCGSRQAFCEATGMFSSGFSALKSGKLSQSFGWRLLNG